MTDKVTTISSYFARLAELDDMHNVESIRIREVGAELGGLDEDTEVTITVEDRSSHHTFAAVCRLVDDKFELVELTHSDPAITFIDANPPEYVYEAINHAMSLMSEIHGAVAENKFPSRDSIGKLGSEIGAELLADVRVAEPTQEDPYLTLRGDGVIICDYRTGEVIASHDNFREIERVDIPEHREFWVAHGRHDFATEHAGDILDYGWFCNDGAYEAAAADRMALLEAEDADLSKLGPDAGVAAAVGIVKEHLVNSGACTDTAALHESAVKIASEVAQYPGELAEMGFANRVRGRDRRTLRDMAQLDGSTKQPDEFFERRHAISERLETINSPQEIRSLNDELRSLLMPGSFAHRLTQHVDRAIDAIIAEKIGEPDAALDNVRHVVGEIVALGGWVADRKDADALDQVSQIAAEWYLHDFDAASSAVARDAIAAKIEDIAAYRNVLAVRCQTLDNSGPERDWEELRLQNGIQLAEDEGIAAATAEFAREADLIELCKEYFSNTHPGVDPSDVDRIGREMAAKHLSDPSILDQVVGDMKRVNAQWTETRQRLAGDQPRDLSGLDALSRRSFDDQARDSAVIR